MTIEGNVVTDTPGNISALASAKVLVYGFCVRAAGREDHADHRPGVLSAA